MWWLNKRLSRRNFKKKTSLWFKICRINSFRWWIIQSLAEIFNKFVNWLDCFLWLLYATNGRNVSPGCVCRRTMSDIYLKLIYNELRLPIFAFFPGYKRQPKISDFSNRRFKFETKNYFTIIEAREKKNLLLAKISHWNAESRQKTETWLTLPAANEAASGFLMQYSKMKRESEREIAWCRAMMYYLADEMGLHEHQASVIILCVFKVWGTWALQLLDVKYQS